MPHTKQRLPEGRGLYRDEEAFINQGESFNSRKSLIPAQNGGLVSTVPPYMITTTVSPVANRILLYLISIFEQDTLVEEGRVRVTTSAASATIQTAIYVYDRVNDMFNRMVKTLLTHSAATTGLRQTRLTEPIRLSAGKRYFIGIRSSDALVAVAAVAGASGIINNLRLDVSAGDLPASLKRTTLTAEVTGATPAVAYLSRFWREVV